MNCEDVIDKKLDIINDKRIVCITCVCYNKK